MTIKRVLIVEDNPLNMELVTDLLESAGWHVFQAQTGGEALRLAETCSPDLVLMDLSLPGMDGLTATKRLRANPATRHLPIIALTAHAMKEDEPTALQAGCDGYLTKPLNTRTLVAELATFSRRPSQVPQNMSYSN
jgi:CheY-like chemotaxis protein